MNVEVNTGRWGTWRSPATDNAARGQTDIEVQVVPLEMYDSARAKIAANLRWLFAKAFGTDDVPTDLQDPFYTDQYEQEHIKPPIIRLLLSAELYCKVCGLILQPEHAASLHSHQSVIQALSRKGIYVLEDNNILVSELDLTSVPIKMSSHIHLIDALMMAYTVEMISIEKVVSSVKCFANLGDSEELPCHLEDAIVFWINKVNINTRETAQKELKMKHLLQSSGHQKVRCRKEHLSGQSHQHFSLLDNLSNFICNGTALLAVVHFYCPELIRLEDICLKEAPSIADSLYNIQLLREFSDKFLNKCFYLGPEDILYSPPVLKSNIIQFIAELFWIFEVVKPDFVQPRDISEIKDARLLLQPQSSRSHDSSSDVTKRSFMTLSNSGNTMATATNPEISSKIGSYSSVLPQMSMKEQKVVEDPILVQRNRSNSVTLGQQSTTFAWPGKRQRQRPLSQTVPYALHFPMSEDANSISFARSISKDSLASNFMSTTPKHMLGPGHRCRLSGHSLLDLIRFEDEEEEREEEELVAIIDPTTLPRHQYQGEIEQRDLANSTTASRVKNTHVSLCCDTSPLSTKHPMDRYYLEPLMPTIPKPAKEKSVSVNKEEECGESDFRGRFAVRKISTSGSGALHRSTLLSESKHTPSSITVSKSVITSPRTPIEGSAGTSQRDSRRLAHGFFLHLSEGPKDYSPLSSLEGGNDSDSDIENLIEDKEDQLELTEDMVRSQGSCYRRGQGNFGEGESAKLGEDLKVSEWDDKEDHSGCSSPCLSTVSWSSSCSTSGGTGVKMTSFAEKKKLKLGLRDELFSTSSTPKTTPDGSETASCPPWQLTNCETSCSLKEPCFVSRKNVIVNSPVVPSELLELHMQLEERRHAIEFQKKKMESLSAQQRLKLGKAAFLNIVKKEAGKSDTLPLPLKQETSEVKAADRSNVKTQTSKDDSCLEALKMKARQTEGAQMIRDNKLSQDSGTQSDLNECSRSIEVLNEAIASIQQQMTQLSLQQDMLIKHRAMSPSESTKLQSDISTPNTGSTAHPSKAFVVNFVNNYDCNSLSLQCPPKLSSTQRKARKQNKQKNTKILENNVNSYGDDKRWEVEENLKAEHLVRNSTLGDDINQHCAREEKGRLPVTFQTPVISSNTAIRQDENSDVDSEKEAAVGDDNTMIKAQLIEVDLSEIRESLGPISADSESEQKNVLGFFFKDDERTDEMAKRRAAFLLKQQRKAEEAKLRKQQQEAESELKRDEARRKAEEERIRKEEEKARRELIKQEYLRRKQQMLMEEQGLGKPWPRTRSRKSRPKSLHREGSNSLSKGSTTPDLSGSHRGSTVSLATEFESAISVESQRAESVCSMESFPVLSRASSRNKERDWENGSIASSITSTEYTGPKLFKEPSSKSNKPIIINAIAHCCLAGKVNETQKNVILEELDKCESNHLIILFRDGGCQFRAIYSYSPDTEEIIKITGTGPRNISQKMIDKLYKYSSDRKQFSVIPAKSMSVSVDALTIHSHLWHVRRPGSARRK